MLKQLYIRNFTLIDELNIQLFPGFSVITGETGAGKSIILGAIGLLLGQRADARNLKEGRDKCVIEAHFDLSRYHMDQFFIENDIDYDAEDCILRREISKNGKSRAFINDSPVQLSLMRALGETLIDIHSQHQNLLLNKEDFQLSVVDIIADDEKVLSEYKKKYAEYIQAQKKLEKLELEISHNKENEEFLRFQYNEIEKADLKDGLQEQLEQETEQLSHSEEIKAALYETDNALNNDENGIVTQIKQAAERLHNIENVYYQAGELANRLDNCHIEIKDISQEISRDVDNIDFDPDKLEKMNMVLDGIYSLEQKFHVNTIAELLNIQTDLKEQLSHIDNSDEEIEVCKNNVKLLLEVCGNKAKELTELRKKAAIKIEKGMQKRLIPLGIPNVRFQIQFSPKDISTDGVDRISFLFSANKSTPLQPISQVASGGEIARVMLSIKAMISGAVKLPTIIFDEIDTGVSGRVAEQMAQIMQEMGQANRQVISITHLPQIAALGAHHYKVEKLENKDGTTSNMHLLSKEERIQEIAQMLSGSNVSAEAINNAKSLLKFK